MLRAFRRMCKQHGSQHCTCLGSINHPSRSSSCTPLIAVHVFPRIPSLLHRFLPDRSTCYRTSRVACLSTGLAPFAPHSPMLLHVSLPAWFPPPIMLSFLQHYPPSCKMYAPRSYRASQTALLMLCSPAVKHALHDGLLVVVIVHACLFRISFMACTCNLSTTTRSGTLPFQMPRPPRPPIYRSRQC